MSIQRWADDAMFHAEPMAESDGLPRVYLLSMSADPLGEIASLARMYEGKPCYDLEGISNSERARYFQSIQETKLKAPFEAVKLHFFVEGISRSTTHQMVRQRTAVYAQESLRFAVKDEITVVEPPTIRAIRIKVKHSPVEQDILAQWDRALGVDWEAYNFLIENGIPAEDARELLPHATATRIHYVTDLRNLIEHAGNRLCTQAVPVWRVIFTGIVDAIRNFAWTPNGAGTKQYGREWAAQNGWQFEMIANSMLFRPACYQEGHCPFSSDIDRGCTIRGRVDAFAKRGIASTEWHQGFMPNEDDPNDDDIPPIRPEEWLLNINAGRTHR